MKKIISVAAVVLFVFAGLIACGDDHDHAFDPAGEVVALAHSLRVRLPNNGDALDIRGRVAGEDMVQVFLENDEGEITVSYGKDGELLATSDTLIGHDPSEYFRITKLEFHNETDDGESLIEITITDEDRETTYVHRGHHGGILWDSLALGTGWPQPERIGDASTIFEGVANGPVEWVNEEHHHH